MNKTKLWRLIICFMISLFVCSHSNAQQPRAGILNQKAPTWDVTDWIQLPEGKSLLDIGDFQGKVLYLYCFQSWCPGCRSHGFPTLQKLTRYYKDDSEVVFVAVQTTFEGFSVNTFERMQSVAEQYNLKIPFGQSGSRGAPSTLMRNYRTGGTPWSIIVDKEGVVRFNQFHIRPEDAIQLIENLKKR